MDKGKQQTVLITGASSGIGKATAIHLSRKGYAVIGTSRSKKRLRDFKSETSDIGLKIKGFIVDVRSDDSVDYLISELRSESIGVDVLINNAGFGLWGPLELLTIDEIKSQFETNLFGVCRMINGLLGEMKRRRSGKIINISSGLGRLATPFNGAYASSKFALEGMSEALRSELMPLGVHVCLVEPGLFRTAFKQNQIIGSVIKSAEYDHNYYSSIETHRGRPNRYERFVSDPIVVARVIHKIIKSKSPALRHPVGIDARLGMIAARAMPERLFQALLRKVTM